MIQPGINCQCALISSKESFSRMKTPGENAAGQKKQRERRRFFLLFLYENHISTMQRRGEGVRGRG